MTARCVLVTGATGFVGSYLCRVLAEPGWTVRAAVRRQAHVPGAVEQAVVGDIDANTDWSSALEGVGAVVHLAARVHRMGDRAQDPLKEYRLVNVEGTRHLADSSAAAGVRRFVFVSSIKANGEEDPLPYTEDRPPRPVDPYGVSKWEAEQALWGVARASGLEVVVLRPPLVYGPGVRANFLSLMRLVQLGLPLPLKSIRNRRSFIYVGNLADAIGRCLVHPAAAGRTYLLSDGEAVSTPELMRRLATAMGTHARLVPCPPALLHGAAKLLGKVGTASRLLGSLEVDMTRIQGELEWTPPFRMEEGLRRVAMSLRDDAGSVEPPVP